MPTTCCLNNRYQLWKVLSEGPLGVVYLAEDRFDPARPVILKSLLVDGLEEGSRFYEHLG